MNALSPSPAKDSAGKASPAPPLALLAVIALGAIGLTLTYAILRFANFAHGEFLTFGAYLALLALGQFQALSTTTFGPLSFGYAPKEVDIVADTVQFLGSRGDDAGQGSPQQQSNQGYGGSDLPADTSDFGDQPAGVASGGGSDDDIPF